MSDRQASQDFGPGATSSLRTGSRLAARCGHAQCTALRRAHGSRCFLRRWRPSEHLVQELTELVNAVYATAEAGLWIDGATRTTVDEMRQMIAAEEIAVARVDGEVVGCVRIQQLDDGIGEFGMLVHPPCSARQRRRRQADRLRRGRRPEPGVDDHAARAVAATRLDASREGVPGRLVHAPRLPAGAHGPHRGELPAPQSAARRPSDFVVYHKALSAPGRPELSVGIASQRTIPTDRTEFGGLRSLTAW